MNRFFSACFAFLFCTAAFPATAGIWVEAESFARKGGWVVDQQFSDRMGSDYLMVDDVIRKFIPRGLSQVICTDISKDGMLKGPSFDLYDRLQGSFPDVEITASGGIASLDDILTLDSNGIRSVIVGKAIYEGTITFEQLRSCLQNE